MVNGKSRWSWQCQWFLPAESTHFDPSMPLAPALDCIFRCYFEVVPSLARSCASPRWTRMIVICIAITISWTESSIVINFNSFTSARLRRFAFSVSKQHQQVPISSSKPRAVAVPSCQRSSWKYLPPTQTLAAFSRSASRPVQSTTRFKFFLPHLISTSTYSFTVSIFASSASLLHLQQARISSESASAPTRSA